MMGQRGARRRTDADTPAVRALATLWSHAAPPPVVVIRPPLGRWLEELGLELAEVTGALVTGSIELGPRHHTPFGVVHGGVYATIVETMGSLGATAAVADRGQFAVGTHNATDFLRPFSEGRVDAVAVPVLQGRNQQLWTVDLSRRSDGKLLAQGRLRLQNLALADAPV